jgi:hypothetical protein
MGKSLWIPILIILLPYGLSHASNIQSPAQEYRTANKLFAAARYKDAIPLYQRILAFPRAVSATFTPDSVTVTSASANMRTRFRHTVPPSGARKSLIGLQPSTGSHFAACSWAITPKRDRISEDPRTISLLGHVGRYGILLGRQGIRAHG